ncbi:hypothetical protein [Xanthomonas hyacinthi]|nr:hypothetical protein [Xanthomonas hyacinthi]
MKFLDGHALIVPIACVVRHSGGKPNWAMLVAILAAITIARGIQAVFGLPEHAFPVLCGAFVGLCILLAMSLSTRCAASGKLCGNAG